MKHCEIQQLTGSLSHFGLNPGDWIMSFPVCQWERKVMIFHKEEKSFSLIGRYCFYKSGLMFEEICLYSL